MSCVKISPGNHHGGSIPAAKVAQLLAATDTRARRTPAGGGKRSSAGRLIGRVAVAQNSWMFWGTTQRTSPPAWGALMAASTVAKTGSSVGPGRPQQDIGVEEDQTRASSRSR